MRLKDLREGDNLPGDSGNPMDQAPEWMDFDRFRRGRDFFFKHILPLIFSLYLSLVTGLSISNLLNPLVFTERSDTPKKALGRYFHTFLHLLLWHTEDVWEAPDGRAHKSVKMVRKMHNSVAERMNKREGTPANGKGKSKLFLSQYDMGLVQSGFFGALIMYPEEFGVVCSEQELSDYVFFWRGMGYLLGVDDKYNICSGGLQDAQNICKEIEKDLLFPALDNPPEEFDKMSLAYVQGMNIPSRGEFMSRDALFAFMRSGWGHPVPRLGFLDTLRFYFLKSIVFLTRWCPFFERVCNLLLLRLFRQQVTQLKLDRK